MRSFIYYSQWRPSSVYLVTKIIDIRRILAEDIIEIVNIVPAGMITLIVEKVTRGNIIWWATPFAFQCCCIQNEWPMITQMARFHVANMEPIWVLSAPGGPHVGPMDFAIRVIPYISKRVVLRFFDAMKKSHAVCNICANVNTSWIITMTLRQRHVSHKRQLDCFFHPLAHVDKIVNTRTLQY